MIRTSLIYKLAVSTCMVVAVAIAIYAYVNVGNLRRMLVDEAISDTDNLSETIIRTTHYQMLENDRKRLYQMMSEVSTQQGIEVIRLVNKEGSIVFSTHQKEVGGSLEKTSEACRACHAGDKPLLEASSMNRSRIYSEGGKNLLEMTRAIYNERRCYTADCHFHPPTSKILGVLNVHVSLAGMHAQLDEYRHKTLVLTVFLLGLVVTGLTMLTQEMVNKPLRKLLGLTEKVAEGNLDVEVDIDSRDEIGELAEAFRSMTSKLKKARAELEEWARTLEVKVDERTAEVQRIQAQLIHSEKLASLGALVAGIAHEINNPLSGILIFVSLLAQNKKLDPSLRDDLETISRETIRCARIVKGLLDFSRESIPEKSPTDLNEVMDAALSLVEHQSLFQNIGVTRDYHPELPLAHVDRNQIEQVFVNMVINAGQAMTGGGTLEIGTGISPEGENVLVKVTDSGCGIAPENIGRIFDPFFTTKEGSGTGLGLSVSYGIVKNHGGEIEVCSSVGIGTTFTIRLPLHSPEPGAVAASEPWEGIFSSRNPAT